MTTVLSKNKPAVMLHSSACMISVDELLHLMSMAELTNVDLQGLLNNHATAIAGISDAQINAFIDIRKHRAGTAGSMGERALLSALAVKLRIARDRASLAVTVH